MNVTVRDSETRRNPQIAQIAQIGAAAQRERPAACAARPREGGLVRRSLGEGGFTLIEILITIGLLTIVLALLFIPISSSLGYFRTATARADAQTVARAALDSIARELSEAMAVQLDMYDGSMIAFIPPLRLDPSDPNSEIVTPPRPDWDRAIRFWQALNDPTRNYNPGAYLEPSNMYFLARTVIDAPSYQGDAWNRWNKRWEKELNDLILTTGVPRGFARDSQWWAIPRAVNSDIDATYDRTSGKLVIGRRNRTLQPGYPYLMVVSEYGPKLPVEGVRKYRDLVVGLTPNAPEYDVPQLSFTPTAVSGERLRPIDGADGPNGCVYRAGYPLWRQGTAYTGWSAFAGNQQLIDTMKYFGMEEWARDPFLLIARYVPGGPGQPGAYEMQGIGAFDPRTRTMRVLDLARGVAYDTVGYPASRPRPLDIVLDRTIPWFGFGIDWADGSLRFDFPAVLRVNDPSDTSATLPKLDLADPEHPRIALDSYWQSYVPSNDLFVLVIPGSVSVRRVEMTQDALTKLWRTTFISSLKQVYCLPREGRDEFQLGLDPAETGAAGPRYGFIRLPKTLSGGASVDANTKLWIEYRWRNNGVMPKPKLDEAWVEKPDMIAAYYRTDAVIDVSITVSRADPSAPVGKRIAQSAFLTRRVKLHNLLREIRYGESK